MSSNVIIVSLYNIVREMNSAGVVRLEFGNSRRAGISYQ